MRERERERALYAAVDVKDIGHKIKECQTAQRVSKKSYSNILMDEDDINGLIQRCQKLKQKLRGVFAADNFPSKMTTNNF